MPGTTVFSALANPTRRAVLDLLRDRPHYVNDLAAEFEMRRPSLSEHLRVLREAGLVTVEQHGRERLYRLDPEPLQEVAAWLHPYEEFWRDRLGGLRRLLDAEQQDIQATRQGRPGQGSAETTPQDEEHPPS